MPDRSPGADRSRRAFRQAPQQTRRSLRSLEHAPRPLFGRDLSRVDRRCRGLCGAEIRVESGRTRGGDGRDHRRSLQQLTPVQCHSASRHFREPYAKISLTIRVSSLTWFE